MKIAVDLRPLNSPTSKRGIGYFTKHLFSSLLKKSHPGFEFSLLTFPKSSITKNFEIGANDKFQKVPALYWPKKGLRRLDPFFSIVWSRFLKTYKPDLIHITSLFEVYFISIPEDIKSVVTLYDVIPLIFPDQYFRNEKAKRWYEERLVQAKKASKIITISKSSKKDIQKFLNIPSEKIEVIYGGVDERFKKVEKEKALRIIEKYKIVRPYILSVSTHSFHKNISRIFLAFKSYINLKSNDDLNLVVVCKLIPNEEAEWKNEIRKLAIEERVILTNFVSDEDLPAIYGGAELFLFPSLYEGLGLPVLEAFACGTAVITSNTSSLPEVGGDAAIYVNPESVEEIRNSIAKILNNLDFKKKLIKRGYWQVKKFSWDKASDQCLNVYRKVLTKH